MRILTRKHTSIVRTNIELMASLNDRLEDYCKLFGWSKRKIIEDALLIWMNQRDMERVNRGGKK
jgi:hypothetical protein